MSIGPNNWQPIYLFFFFLAEILECWAPAPKGAVLMSFAGSPLFCADKMSAVFSLYHLPGVLFFHLKMFAFSIFLPYSLSFKLGSGS